MHKRTNIQLSRADCSKLKAVVADRNSPQKHVWRAKIVLLTADGCGTAEIMRRAGTSKTAVWRWQERFMTDRVAGLLGRDRPRGLDAQDAASAAARLLPCDQPRAY